jgi:hypothetical protein
MLRKFHSFDNWTKTVVLLMWGSTVLGKASGYLWLAIGAALLLDARVLWDRWCAALIGRKDPLTGVSWAILVSLLYGFGQVIYGYLSGYALLTTLQILIFNICPVYLFLGIWVGARHPGVVRRYIRFLAVFMVVYSPLYFLFFNKLHLSLSGLLPGNNLEVLGNPGSGSEVLVGLIAYEPNLARFWLPILVVTCLTIANQERADWLGLGIALAIWGALARKMNRVLAIAGFVVAVLLIAFLIDLRLPALPGRGGEISARETVARMAAAISPQLSRSVGGDPAKARFYYGTVFWRKHWWANIRGAVSQNPRTMMFGLGYGYPLGELASADVVRSNTRSPHSVFYFALGYSGCVGVVIFFWLQGCMLALLWRAYKVTGVTFALAFYIPQLVGSFLGNSIETPGGGIFLYLMAGLLVGPMLVQLDSARRAAEVAQLAGFEDWAKDENEWVNSAASSGGLVNESTY